LGSTFSGRLVSLMTFENSHTFLPSRSVVAGNLSCSRAMSSSLVTTSAIAEEIRSPVSVRLHLAPGDACQHYFCSSDQAPGHAVQESRLFFARQAPPGLAPEDLCFDFPSMPTLFYVVPAMVPLAACHFHRAQVSLFPFFFLIHSVAEQRRPIRPARLLSSTPSMFCYRLRTWLSS